MIKKWWICVYNGNEYELNEDNDGNLIIITTNREIIDATFVDEYNSGVYSKIISPNEIQEAYECRTYGLINGYKVSIRKELKDTFLVGTGDRKSCWYTWIEIEQISTCMRKKLPRIK